MKTSELIELLARRMSKFGDLDVQVGSLWVNGGDWVYIKTNRAKTESCIRIDIEHKEKYL